MKSCSKPFLWIFGILFLLFVVDLHFHITGIKQSLVIFRSGQDYLADFLNCVRYASNLDPYFDDPVTNLERIYPPLAYLILYPFKFIDINNLHSGISPFSPLSLTGILLSGASAIALIAVISKFAHKNTSAILISLCLLFSRVSIFSVERGNLIWIAAIATAVFLFLYDRKEPSCRISAAIAISLAISIKIYPAVFLCLWFERSHLKDLTITIAFTAALGLLPLALLEHSPIENSLQLLQNVREQGKLYFEYAYPQSLSASAYCCGLARSLHPTSKLVLLAANITKFLAPLYGIICIIASFKAEERWQKFFLLATSIVFLASNSMYYCLLYFLPAIFIFLTGPNNYKLVGKILCVLFAFLLTPLQILTPTINGGIFSLSEPLATLIITIASALCLWLTIRQTPRSAMMRRIDQSESRTSQAATP